MSIQVEITKSTKANEKAQRTQSARRDAEKKKIDLSAPPRPL